MHLEDRHLKERPNHHTHSHSKLWERKCSLSIPARNRVQTGLSHSIPSPLRLGDRRDPGSPPLGPPEHVTSARTAKGLQGGPGPGRAGPGRASSDRHTEIPKGARTGAGKPLPPSASGAEWRWPPTSRPCTG